MDFLTELSQEKDYDVMDALFKIKKESPASSEIRKEPIKKEKKKDYS